MRQIEERTTVIGPGAIVRLKKEASGSIKDLMARWRVLGVDEDLLRVEDTEDPEDVCTLPLENVERVSGGAEVVESALVPEATGGQWPEHDRWPACIRYDKFASNGVLFDDPEDCDDEEEDE